AKNGFPFFFLFWNLFFNNVGIILSNIKKGGFIWV
ncbi:hypothetical protein GUU_01887, partial [Malacoplasma iowae 695]